MANRLSDRCAFHVLLPWASLGLLLLQFHGLAASSGRFGRPLRLPADSLQGRTAERFFQEFHSRRIGLGSSGFEVSW